VVGGGAGAGQHTTGLPSTLPGLFSCSSLMDGFCAVCDEVWRLPLGPWVRGAGLTARGVPTWGGGADLVPRTRLDACPPVRPPYLARFCVSWLIVMFSALRYGALSIWLPSCGCGPPQPACPTPLLICRFLFAALCGYLLGRFVGSCRMASDPVFPFLRDKQGTLGAKPGYEALTAACEETGITFGMFSAPQSQHCLLMVAGVSAESCQYLLGYIGLEAFRRIERALLYSAAVTAGCLSRLLARPQMPSCRLLTGVSRRGRRGVQAAHRCVFARPALPVFIQSGWHPLAPCVLWLPLSRLCVCAPFPHSRRRWRWWRCGDR
jgi:hypothetical protein